MNNNFEKIEYIVQESDCSWYGAPWITTCPQVPGGISFPDKEKAIALRNSLQRDSDWRTKSGGNRYYYRVLMVKTSRTETVIR